MEPYSFDTIIERKNSAKWDEMHLKFGASDLLPFWIADMDFKSPEPVIKALQERALEGVYGYSSRPDSYYRAISEWLKQRHNWVIQDDWLIHSPGIITSLTLILREFTAPGDKIIIQPPVYYPFFDTIVKNGRVLVANPLKSERGRYVMDYEDLEKKLAGNVKYLLLCSPHNPVGRVWEEEELLKLGELCLKHKVKVISDEIHADIVYKGHKHIPFASLGEEYLQNTITCISPNKTFNMAGLQSSCLILPVREDYEKFEESLGILDIKRNNCFSLVATEAAYRYGGEWLDQLLVYLERNADYTVEFLRERIPQIKTYKPEGTYLIWLDCKDLVLSREELADFMLNKAKVALDYGYWFGQGGEDFLRINIACPQGILRQGLERLEKAVKML